MTRALDPDDTDNPEPYPPPAAVAGDVRAANLGMAYDHLSRQGVTAALAEGLVQALAYDAVLDVLRYADLVAQALVAFTATPSVPLPAAFADWKARWLAGRITVEGEAADILLDL